jgi:uncharacterized protein YndB with AHSA1/START domain
MASNSSNIISSSRALNAPLNIVYHAFENPKHLANWWGPEGFTNTFHEFNLQPGGKWILTMHGPEKGNYENASVFKTIEPQKLITWERASKPLFNMEVAFEKLSNTKTKISFKMIFESAEECNKLKPFVIPKNEENFDRLERELLKVIV